MTRIVTVTINPAVDVSTTVDRVEPVRKLRCSAERREPGGGGINVARVISRFGADVVAVYAAGGVTGQMLQGLVHREGVAARDVANFWTIRLSDYDKRRLRACNTSRLTVPRKEQGIGKRPLR